jgi:hypothetical protein
MQDILCATIDVSEKISIDGDTPTTKQFLAFVPDVDRTLYQPIDAANDININILPAMSAAIAQDELLIYDSTDGTNKKISATSLETVYTASVGLTLTNKQFTFIGGDILTAPIKTTGAVKSGTLESNGDTTVNGYLYCNDTLEMQDNDIADAASVTAGTLERLFFLIRCSVQRPRAVNLYSAFSIMIRLQQTSERLLAAWANSHAAQTVADLAVSLMTRHFHTTFRFTPQSIC